MKEGNGRDEGMKVIITKGRRNGRNRRGERNVRK